MSLRQAGQPYGVTILPPSIGLPPAAPLAVRPALDLFDVIAASPRSLRDRLETSLSTTLRQGLSAIAKMPFRPQAHGLSTTETAHWAEQVTARLAPADHALLLEYVHTCHVWVGHVRQAVGSDKADPDWDMTSARNVPPSAPEAYLAQTLEAAGIPVRTQVGVAKKDGGRRRGGWYGAFWLDCAHRDPAYLLRINIELDGQYHYTRERQAKDGERNSILAERGWYVARLSGRVLGQENHRIAVDRLVALAERHRRAILLARSDLRMLARQLTAGAGAA